MEFVSVAGVDPDRLSTLARAAPGVREARPLRADADEALFAFVSESPVATALADNECTFTDIRATAGEGRLVAEVPPHVDASAVIDAFLEQYPDARLAARRETDRTAPTLTEAQLRDRLVGDPTDRQLEVLRVAHAGGYFEQPRDRGAQDLAEDLDIAVPTFSQRLRAAQRKLFDQLFAVRLDRRSAGHDRSGADG